MRRYADQFSVHNIFLLNDFQKDLQYKRVPIFYFQLNVKVEKILKGKSVFDPITFTFSENSNYGRESLLLKTKSLLPGNVLPYHLK